jgi:hypothetical protein
VNRNFSPWLLLTLALIGAAVLAVCYAINESFVPNVHGEALGQLGDFFGGLLNPFVSILTLVVAINVWRLQKAELESTKLALEAQADTAGQQRREQRFFDLLNLYHSTVQSVATGVRDQQSGLLVLSGKEAIARLVMESGFRSITTSSRETPSYLPASQISKAAEKVQQMGLFLDHYFRVVFTFLRDARMILGDKHFRYVKLFRAQPSKGELEALALNLIFDPEGKKLRLLVEEYGILKHLQESQLRRLAEEELQPKSFGRNWVRSRTLTSHDAYAP